MTEKGVGGTAGMISSPASFSALWDSFSVHLLLMEATVVTQLTSSRT